MSDVAEHATRTWTETYESLSSADRATPLDAEDLERLATAAHMLGRHEEYVAGLERAHHAYLDSARVFEHEAAGDHEAAIAAAAEAAEIAQRFGDADLFALAAQDHGILLISQG